MKLKSDLSTQLSFFLAAIAIILRMASDWLFKAGGPLPYQVLQASLLALALAMLWPNLEIIFLKGGKIWSSIKEGFIALPLGLLAGLGIAFVQFGEPQLPYPVQVVTIIANNLFFPAVEELEFRGFLLGWMSYHKMRPSLAVWLAAAFHTLAHPHYLWQGNYVSFIFIFLLTAWFGWLTIRTRSLWGAYIAHALWNISFFLSMPKSVRLK